MDFWSRRPPNGKREEPSWLWHWSWLWTLRCCLTWVIPLVETRTCVDNQKGRDWALMDTGNVVWIQDLGGKQIPGGSEFEVAWVQGLLPTNRARPADCDSGPNSIRPNWAQLSTFWILCLPFAGMASKELFSLTVYWWNSKAPTWPQLQAIMLKDGRTKIGPAQNTVATIITIRYFPWSLSKDKQRTNSIELAL